jgi:peroxiredoxin
MKQYFILILIIVFFVSCKDRIKIIFPDIVQDEIEQYMQKHKYIVVIYIDSAACTPCSLNHLTLWKKHREELDNNNTGILLVIHHFDEQVVINALKSIKITFHFVIDKERKFKATNIEVFYKTWDNTFVMNRNKNVIFTGSSITTEKIWKSFIKLIKH